MTKILPGTIISRFLLISMLVFSSINSSYAFENGKLQVHKITLSAVNITLEDVFKTIHQQTGLIISNNLQETTLNENKKITVSFKETDISEVMAFLLSDKKELAYSLTNNAIHIYKKSDQKKISISEKISDTIANPILISGIVKDGVSGNAIPNATIKIKKQPQQGTVANLQGAFLLPYNVNKGDIIVISAVGFETSEIKVIDKHVIISLKPLVNKLDETVITAYSSTTKRFNTGNISIVKAADIEKQPVNNPLLALQGRVPGIFLEQATGIPGTGVTVRIQGQNSITKGNDPFYVIDGVPYISQLLLVPNNVRGSSGTFNQGIPITGSPFSFINPADIESIEILKDADATAIYGSRAANGAILITTKKGHAGQTKININLQNGWSKVGHKLKVLNTTQYLEMRREGLKNDHMSPSPSASDADVNGTWDTTRNIDWQKELIGGTAQYKDIHISVSGGNYLTQYLVAGTYHKETTVFPGDFSDTKGAMHFNINSTSNNQKFKLELSGLYLIDNNRLPGYDLTLKAITLAPNAPPPFNPDGTLNWQPNFSGSSTYQNNPMASSLRRSGSQTNNLTSSLQLSYQILPGLNIRNRFGYNALLTTEMQLDPAAASVPEYRDLFTRTTQNAINTIFSYILEPNLEFAKTINRGKLNATVGNTISKNTTSATLITTDGFASDVLMENPSAADQTKIFKSNTVYKYNGLFARLNYNWQDAYIINFNARRDGSSRFGNNQQFHNFGSIGAAWIFSQSPLLREHFPMLSFGKLRASYGTSGNDQIGDYTYLNLYQSYRGGNALYQNAIGLEPTSLANPYVIWEETKKLTVGLELGLFKDKIMFEVNYHRNRSSNQLVILPLPGITGFSSITGNLPATIQNTGWEFTLNTINIETKNFTWHSNINLTIPKNKLYNVHGLNLSYYIDGMPITAQRVYDFAGVNDSTGLYQFKTSKGGLTSSPNNPDDKTAIVTSEKLYYGGFENQFKYKGWSLDMLFQFVKQSAFNLFSFGVGALNPGFAYYGSGNQPVSVLDRWQKRGDITSIQGFHAGYSGIGPYYAVLKSSAIFGDASYIRLKNISMSWQCPDRWRKAAHLQDLLLFVQGQNLFTISDFFGLDPESISPVLPPLRNITIGARITL